MSEIKDMYKTRGDKYAPFWHLEDGRIEMRGEIDVLHVPQSRTYHIMMATKPLNELEMCPLEYHPQQVSIKAKHTAKRGGK